MANQQGAKIIVYWLEKSRAQRIIYLLEELNLEYEIQTFKRGKDRLAPKELRDIHPLGKSPLVGVQPAGADKPIILAESGTIIEYLTEHFGKHLIPARYPEGKEGIVGAETQAWMRYRYLLHYGEGSLMSLLVNALVVNAIGNAPVPFFLKPITKGIAGRVNGSFINPQIKLHLTFLEDYLAASPDKGENFCGHDLSAADIMLIFALEGAMAQGSLTEANYPKLHAWVRRIQASDSYKRAGEKVTEAFGEPYVPFSEQAL